MNAINAMSKAPNTPSLIIVITHLESAIFDKYIEISDCHVGIANPVNYVVDASPIKKPKSTEFCHACKKEVGSSYIAKHFKSQIHAKAVKKQLSLQSTQMNVSETMSFEQ
jgi:hypothetical protein